MSRFPSKAKFKQYTEKKRLSRSLPIEELINLSSDVDDFLKRLAGISVRDISKIERCTVDQYKNNLWFICRKHNCQHSTPCKQCT